MVCVPRWRLGQVRLKFTFFVAVWARYLSVLGRKVVATCVCVRMWWVDREEETLRLVRALECSFCPNASLLVPAGKTRRGWHVRSRSSSTSSRTRYLCFVRLKFYCSFTVLAVGASLSRWLVVTHTLLQTFQIYLCFFSPRSYWVASWFGMQTKSEAWNFF